MFMSTQNVASGQVKCHNTCFWQARSVLSLIDMFRLNSGTFLFEKNESFADTIKVGNWRCEQSGLAK